MRKMPLLISALLAGVILNVLFYGLNKIRPLLNPRLDYVSFSSYAVKNLNTKEDSLNIAKALIKKKEVKSYAINMKQKIVAVCFYKKNENENSISVYLKTNTKMDVEQFGLSNASSIAAKCPVNTSWLKEIRSNF